MPTRCPRRVRSPPETSVTTRGSWQMGTPDAGHSLIDEIIGRVRPAAGIEHCRTVRTTAHTQILVDRQLSPTHPTEDDPPIPLTTRPLLCWVIGAFEMAEMARVVPVAAEESDGDDVQFSRVMLASSVFIDCFAEDGRTLCHHAPILRCWGLCVVQASRRRESFGRESMEGTPNR